MADWDDTEEGYDDEDDVEVYDSDIEEYISSIPRDAKIKRLVDQIDDWDYDTLLESVKGGMQERYDGSDDNDISNEYYDQFSDDLYDEVADAKRAKLRAARAAAAHKTCKCPNLLRDGHTRSDCPYMNRKRLP